ncbi:hypothetical protein HBH82_219840 [Parastagonospora nodorum]|nr:hypothetical protein HBH82_219840 [Parastagonospora nodorum]KAH4694206.1 hypothetical protein HBH67_218400 [Parastagonospora nodorum]KAH4759965.1 hypothetical protein HBH63_216490 [Parastagonospora nodorum]KAH4773570.1 hypothetical protein HBH62_195520 [Parastagonospora nodorum]
MTSPGIDINGPSTFSHVGGRLILRGGLDPDHTKSFNQRVDAIALFQWVKRCCRSLRRQALRLVFMLPAKIRGGADVFLLGIIADD